MDDTERRAILDRLMLRYSRFGPDCITRVLDDTTQTIETIYMPDHAAPDTIEQLTCMRLDAQH